MNKVRVELGACAIGPTVWGRLEEISVRDEDLWNRLFPGRKWEQVFEEWVDSGLASSTALGLADLLRAAAFDDEAPGITSVEIVDELETWQLPPAPGVVLATALELAASFYRAKIPFIPVA